MHDPAERFCVRCGMPLVHGGPADEAPPGGEARERARKIAPAYARGELVRVAGGRNQAEAELIQNLLLEEGVPSLLRRSAGFDVPDFLAAGPRDVLVPESGLETARTVLAEAELASTELGGGAGGGSPGADEAAVGSLPGGGPGLGMPAHAARLLAAIVLAALVTALVAWALGRLAA